MNTIIKTKRAKNDPVFRKKFILSIPKLSK